MTNSLGVLYNPQKSTPPKGWKLIRVGDYAKLVAGGTPSTRVEAYWEDGDILWMRSGDVHKKRIFNVDGKITKDGLENSSATMLPKNSVLIALAGQGKTRGTVAINKVELSTNQSVAAIIPKQKLDYEFLYYNLDARYELLRRLSTGDGGRGGLNLQILKNIWCAVPPLPEQRKIADILFTWDEAIAKTEQLIAVLQKRKKGLMQRLLTGEVRFAEFDGDWKIVALQDIAKIIMGQSPSSSAYNEAKIGLPLVQGNADISSNRKTAPKVYTSEITKECEVGDIILSVRAPVGETAISMHKACIGRGVCAIRATKCDSRFLYHLLVSIEKQWQKYAQGSTFTAINSIDIRKFSLSIPKSKDEQKRIGEVFDTCDTEIELHQTQLATLQQQKKGLMQRLLTGQVRVKV